MSLRAALLTTLFVAMHTGALAQGVSTDPSVAPAGDYAIDKAHTRITWKMSHLGTSFYLGLFSTFDATLKFNPAAPEKSVLKASIDTKSVTTLDPKFDAEIASEKFLDAAKTPTITFESTTIAKTTATTGKMTGNLTLHGVTKPIIFDITFVGGAQSQMKNAYVVGFEAVATFKRSEFGITQYIDFGLGDAVTVTVDTEFDKKAE